MCGVIGVYGTPYSSQEVYQGLQLLQHRGQDAAGILSYQFSTKSFNLAKETGLVSKVFTPEKLKGLVGAMSIGHTRYATVGPKTSVDAQRDIQPMMINYPFGMGMVHNGNLVNYYDLKNDLKENHNRHLFTQNDLEALLNILSKHLLPEANLKNFKFEDFQKAVKNLFDEAQGGYAVLGLLAEKGFFAFRDPHGIRPLVLGERVLTEKEKELFPDHFSKSYCLASESNALNFLGYTVVRDILPGEIILIDQQGRLHSSHDYSETQKIRPRHCMFEWVYFSNPESLIENKSVYRSRLNFGKALAEEMRPQLKDQNITIDLIVPIPETARVAAISLSEELNIPYRELLIKNRYVQRSFILNTQESRKKAVQLKLTAIASEMKGKNILPVDDSIVRGTTSKQIIDLVKEAGANKVYFASTCPPIRHPCFYGVDFPDPAELVAHDKTVEQVAQILGADQLFYLSEVALAKAIRQNDKDQQNLCKACIDGDYPVAKSQVKAFSAMRSQHRNMT